MLSQAVILITGYATVESAIEATKSGAHDYICKPFTQSQIKAAIENAFAHVSDYSPTVDSGKFREDLFYRLCVVPLFLPPLRERKGDVPLLVQHFIQQFCKQMGMEAKAISQQAMRVLEEYNWPGNVRELENTIERAVALTQDDAISPDGLFFTTRKKLSRCVSFEIGTSLWDVEKEIIIRTLEDAGGNKQRTAEVLGITSKTVRSKLRQYGYDSPSQSPDISDIESDP